MQDRVAEVLLEREALGQQNPAGLIISVSFHAAVFFFLIFSPHREMTTERPRVITMRLAPSGAGQQPARPAGDPGTKATIEPRARTVQPPVPAPSVAPAEPPPKPVRTDPARSGEQSIFGTSGKPAPARTATPAPAPPAGGAPGASSESPGSGTFAMPGVGSAGVTGLEGGDFPYDVYIDRMTTRIGSNWLRPGIPGEMITRVHFIIERDGRIRDAKIEAASGNRTFDRAALRAVIESSPLPPLPGQYSGRYLGVYLTFH